MENVMPKKKHIIEEYLDLVDKQIFAYSYNKYFEESKDGKTLKIKFPDYKPIRRKNVT